ncbi:MAG: SdpI family protein, partial [Chloroflexi bacterium]|nr:SdpI family protein [Chloroflexota bacterium]
LRANIEKFKKHYYGFIMLVLLFMFYVHLLTILWNLGIQFDMIRLLVPAFGAILYGCGILLEKSKKNWFIGIRTPWTLSNERVWDKTHRLGARLFKVAAILTLGGIFFRDYAIVFILIPVILVSLFTVVYSYLTYQKEFRANQLRG